LQALTPLRQEIHGMAGSLLFFAIAIRFFSIDNNACNFLPALIAAMSTRIPLEQHKYQNYRSLNSFYQLGIAEDLHSVFLEISCNIMPSSCHLSCKIAHVKTIL
jgi:hypothetical protein